MIEPIRTYLFSLDGDEKFSATTLTSYARKISFNSKTIKIDTMIGDNILDYYNKYKDFVNQHFLFSLIRRTGERECQFKFNNCKLSTLSMTSGHALPSMVLIAKISLKYSSLDILGNTDYNYNFSLLFQTFTKENNALL